MNKLISVIIPYYKKKQYIKATLNSVVNQSYKNLEIIIIYDDKDKKDLKYLQSITIKEKRVKMGCDPNAKFAIDLEVRSIVKTIKKKYRN